MDSVKKLKVVLFALTGFGNQVIKGLMKDPRVEVGAVFTVKYDTPFPYYQESQLLDYCRDNNIPCYYDIKVSGDEGMQILRELSPDLIMVATFKQILKENVIQLLPLGVVNFHPSLLPLYRGPCPSNAALLNGDRITGVTVHYVTEGVDDGNILLQRSIQIKESDNDGILRHKLAVMAGEMIPDTISLFTARSKPSGTIQDHGLASYAPKPKVEQGYLELASDVDSICRMVRAFTPLPGTSILTGNRRLPIDRYEFIETNKPDGVYEADAFVNVVIHSQAIRLYIRDDK